MLLPKLDATFLWLIQFHGVRLESKQWGAINASNNVTYPISFTKIAHPIISINYTSTNIDAAYWPIKSSTLTGFTRVLTALSGHYLAGGY